MLKNNSKITRAYVIPAVILLSLMSAFSITPALANGTVIAVINPETGDSDFTFSSETPINSTFIANITVVDVEFLAAWQVNITWDPTLLRINSTDDATIPADNVFGGDVDPIGLTITDSSMYWMAGIKYGAPFDYVNVTYGTLCQTQFTIIKNDTGGPLSCDIHFVLEGEHVLYTKLIDEVASAIPYTPQDGAYVIQQLPKISVTSPTTGNPIYPEAGEIITINFTYTAQNPENVTLKVYNSTTIIGETTITSLLNGTDIEESGNVTLDDPASDGKYNVEATIYTLDELDSTDTEPEAVIIDTTSLSISDPYQDPPGQVAEPGVTIEVDMGENVNVRVNVTDLTSGVNTVILSYNVSLTGWENITMNRIAGNEYNATIPSSELPFCTYVNYYIIAYDNAGNYEKNPMTEIYYIYHVIPEFASLTILLTLLALAAFVAITKMRMRTTQT